MQTKPFITCCWRIFEAAYACLLMQTLGGGPAKRGAAVARFLGNLTDKKEQLQAKISRQAGGGAMGGVMEQGGSPTAKFKLKLQ
jgi:hypothetical protein